MPNEVLLLSALILFVFVGANASFWTVTSAIRAARERRSRLSELDHLGSGTGSFLQPRDVAILIAAHNEERGIQRTVSSAGSHVPLTNVFVASDGSKDATSAIARAEGANVVDISPNRGKAGALEFAIDWFRLADRFDFLLLLDADTVLAPDYLDFALPLFADDDVVAVAGTARTALFPGPTSRFGELLITHRDRMYVVLQYLLKFGQAARFANAVMIVPGFASLYRTRILKHLDIAAPGLVIEDYNMTFEVHAKRLGRIAFDPRVATAYTQDPDTLRSYVAQVRRWNLGFWQTLRRHSGMQARFAALTTISVIEITLSSLFIVLTPVLVLASLVIGLPGVVAADSLEVLAARFPALLILIAFFVADLSLTLVAVCISRRPAFVKWALFLPLLRWLDAALCLQAALLSFKRGSDGRWRSPVRR
ncbi:glycosyl transferase [Pseudoclavibacter sp. AY1F1]|uniref:glycosyltransferase family 2 protein n=1 Tax=Pseudoclavibacter sp. AY1F1 TaxID=2080583 RepID=UPI000CE8A01E|nr:glycosyltransferase family 2 protein [Pseudoclavibacter sp. AY1F1]PPF42128.1 glycosyl transferase [Pseudoclavibacter sp. AY1F1]